MIDPLHEVSTRRRTRANATELTERQHEALTIIRRHLQVRGVPPSRSELAKEMGIANPSSVDKHLNALAKKGWVELHASVERGIRLLREGAPLLEEDDVAAVTAGTPVVAQSRREPKRLNDFDSFSAQFEARPDYFVRVRGDSLDKAGLRTGDVVAVRRDAQARDGDLVVARTGHDITLMRCRRDADDVIELRPESTNPAHEAIRVDRDTAHIEIVGIVVGAIVGTRRRDKGRGI